MDLAHDVLVFLHFLGLAALLGGLFTQVRSSPRVVNAAVLHGSLTQLVTGLLLVGLREAEEAAVPDQFHLKIGTKLAVTLVIVALAFVYRRAPALKDGSYYALLGLTVLNVAVAVFWELA